MIHFLKNQLRLCRDRFVLERIAMRSHGARIDPRALIRISPTCKLTLGNKVSIGAFALILLETDPHDREGTSGIELNIGDGTYIGEFNNIRAAGKMSIGKNCLISQGVSLIGSSHSIKQGSPIIQQQSSKDKLGMTIEDDVWIGTNSTILSGIHIGTGAIVGAGSVVTKDVPPYTIVAGIPARFLRNR